MRTPILETDRLVLRPFKEEDVTDVFECWESDPDVAKYMFWTSHNDIEKTREWIAFELGQIEKQDWYRFAIVLKGTNTLIGTTLVYYEEEVECWEIGYNLGKKYWGKGYTTEAMKRVIEFATEELRLSQIVGRYAKENPASGRVMRKLGFTYEKDIPYECNNGTVKREGIQCRLLIDNENKQDDEVKKRFQQLNELYEMLERLNAKGYVANAWGGCEDDFSDPDGSVLSDFMEYVGGYYEYLEVTDWMEAFYQVLSWQYQSMHEGVTTYYENFYGGSEYPVIVQTAAFLQQKGYMSIYEQYNKGIVFCEEYEGTKNKNVNANELDIWINWHTKEVWNFSVDILLKHRNEWKWKV